MRKFIVTLALTTALTSFVPPFVYNQSRPNIFGGVDYETPEGKVQSQRNAFGGLDFRFPNGRIIRCTPNVFGGMDCKGR
jgi:hypothetical protein